METMKSNKLEVKYISRGQGLCLGTNEDYDGIARVHIEKRNIIETDVVALDL